MYVSKDVRNRGYFAKRKGKRDRKSFGNTAVVSGPGSSVGVATGYGLGGSGIESRWGRGFPHLPTPALGPPSLLYNGYRVFLGGRKRLGCDIDPSSLLVPRSKNRVQLYLYSP
jgi:hypothetical protein